MRKTYNAPEMKVVKVKTAASMLTGSLDLNSEERVYGNRALSRENRGSSWDDDEEDY